MASILKVDTIQDQDGNNIINESANTITIGASGDTITIPSGATLANSGIVTGFQSTGIDDNATSTAITIDSSQNVGIGTTGGSSKFSILGQVSNSTAKFVRLATQYMDIIQTSSANQILSTGKSFYLSTADSTNIVFQTDNTERMRIDTSGNVGIGTSSPSAKIHGIAGADWNSTNYSFLFQNEETQNSYGNTVRIIGGGGAGAGNSASNILTVGDNDDNIDFVVRGDGNVGIGTSSPAEKLEVYGTEASGGVEILLTNVGEGGGTTVPYTAIRSKLNSLRNGGEIRFGRDSGYTGESSSDSNIQFYTAVNNVNTEAMRINSSGNVGIGTSTPSANLEVRGASSNGQIYLGGSTTATYGQIYSDNDGTLIAAADAGDNAGGSSFRVSVDGSEAMRIDSGLSVFIGKTGLDIGTAGIQFESNGAAGFTRTASNVVYINRRSDDGTLVVFRQDNTTEGSITVSGSTVSYNGFTGTHWSRFTDNSTPTILKGTVLESLDEMCDWYNLEFDVITQDEDGNDVTTTKKIPHVLTDTQSVGDTVTYNHEGTDYQATIVKEADIKHMKSKVSDTVDAKNVYGVFVAYDEDGEGYNDFYVASVGSFVVRIKANETIAKGDLLQSNGDGTAKVQTDDAVRSSSFAKVLSTTIIETYEDGSYLVPCSLMC
jgi:hypothetical protein